MKIGILSDTHGDLVAAKLAVSKMGSINCLLHAGDYYRDAEALGKEYDFPIYAVVGNGDWSMTAPEDLIITGAGKRIWLTHGHTYRVKRGHQTLLAQAVEHNADIVVYGHTHLPAIKWLDGILLFNPGSTSYPRGDTGASYGMLKIRRGKIIPKIFAL